MPLHIDFGATAFGNDIVDRIEAAQSPKHYNVEVYYFGDGSVYIAPRTDDRSIEEIYRQTVNHPAKSPVFQKVREGLLEHKQVIFRDLSRHAARRRAEVLIEYFRAIGRNVLNVRMPAGQGWEEDHA